MFATMFLITSPIRFDVVFRGSDALEDMMGQVLLLH